MNYRFSNYQMRNCVNWYLRTPFKLERCVCFMQTLAQCEVIYWHHGHLFLHFNPGSLCVPAQSVGGCQQQSSITHISAHFSCHPRSLPRPWDLRSRSHRLLKTFSFFGTRKIFPAHIPSSFLIYLTFAGLIRGPNINTLYNTAMSRRYLLTFSCKNALPTLYVRPLKKTTTMAILCQNRNRELLHQKSIGTQMLLDLPVNNYEREVSL